MKKLLCLAMIIAMLSFTACGSEPDIVNLPEDGDEAVQSFSEEEQQGFEGLPEGAEQNSGVNPPAETPAAEPLHVVTPLDAYDEYGYVHFLCEQTGTYKFEVVGDQELQWEVYILDSEFPDAERYIPQVYERSLEGNGEVTVNQGEYIYIYCIANSWTCLDPPENSSYNCYFVQ